MSWYLIGSTICDPTVFTGFSAFIAPWNTIATSVHRWGRIASSPPARISAPFTVTLPETSALGGSNPINVEQRGRLAAPRLADEPEPLALLDVEAHALHGVQPALVRQVEPHVEVVRLQDAHAGSPFVGFADMR